MADRPVRLAARMADIQPFHVMDILARAKAMEAAGRSIIHMEIGEPDFATPQPIVEAGRAALAAGHTHYTPSLGLPALRQAIAHYYATDYGVTVAPERIVVTPGASGALLLALGVLVDPGDQVLMADPGYPCNRHFVRLLEGESLSVPVGADTAYQLTAELVQRHWTHRTIGVMLATPSNPTGTCVTAADLAALATVVRERQGVLVVDEIYHGLVYDTRIPTALGMSDDVFVVNSFSKFFSMTGWRLGWLVVPEAYVDAVDRLAQNLFLAAPTVAQHAALAAFLPETRVILEQRRVEFQRRRDFLLPALREVGFDIPVVPQGAFYLYANAAAFTNDTYVFALDVLEKTGVAITPGLDFGRHRSAQHLRFAYTTSLERLGEAVSRLRHYVGR